MSKYTRTLIWVISKSNSELMSSISLKLSTIDLNKVINHCNSELKPFLAGGRIPLVNLKKNKFDLADKSQIFEGDFKELRVIVHDSTGNVILNDKTADECSHTIEVYAVNDNEDIPCSRCQYDLRVLVEKADQVQSIIEDVVLDIQMFHFYNLGEKFTTTAEKRDFSVKKINFCKFIGLQTQAYSITEGRYCSLASYCRDKECKMNYEQYYSLWLKFYEQINPSPVNDTYPHSTEKLVEYIIANHPQGKQISPRKLSKLISNLSQGEYTLVRWSKRPKSRKNLNKIKILLKGKWCRIGKLLVVPVTKRYSYKFEEEYFTLYDFYIL